MRSFARTNGEPFCKCRAFRTRARGAAAIEFALIFPLFFGILYASVSYSLVMLLQLGMSNAAANGARAAIQLVNPLANTSSTYSNETKLMAAQAVRASLTWLPRERVDAIVASIKVGPNTTAENKPGPLLTVEVQWAGYDTDPLIPSLQLPLIGRVPPLPEDLSASATIVP